MADPGWYPDPMGLWDERWWNGNTWDEAVRTGTHQDTEPLRAVEDLIRTPPDDGVIWQGTRGVDMIGHEEYVLTGVFLRMYSRLDRPPEAEWPLWTVARADPRFSAGQTMLGIGDVELTIHYAGYQGRTTQVLKNVPDPIRAAALICRQSRLARIAAGYPEPQLPRA